MKKIYALILLVQAFLPTYCQIGTTDVAAPKQQEVVAVFDSTRNFLGNDNVYSYKGQLVYDKKNDVYYYVDSVNMHVTYGFRTEYHFYLSEKDNQNKHLKITYDPRYEHTFPYIVVSHFNYLKKKYIGQEVIVYKRFLDKYDIKTGNPIDVNDDTKTYWKVKEITILNNKYRSFVLVLENASQTATFEVDRLTMPGNNKVLYLKSEWSRLCSKYGASMMKTALHQQIMVGMPQELLINSWGEPDRINSASYGDQYVYGDDCVYLKRGKVTSWN